jgi:hypothetical protein
MWFKYVLITLSALSALFNIIAVGKEREPITNGMAVFSVLYSAMIIAGIVYYL